MNLSSGNNAVLYNNLLLFYLLRMSASTIISYIGLNYASATSASAVINLLPVLTFFLAVLFSWKHLLKLNLAGYNTCSFVLPASFVFLSMTVPLTLVFTIILTFLIGEVVTLGSVISGVLMVGGLYNVLWGKRIEQVAMGMQCDDGRNAASDLEEQETTASVPGQRISLTQF
ncbi:hypothetical protein HU200_050379 [Digitaria exilis]|uniref:WAT1-related protein n=1 Tax=Digitaria exilis TaxID=1010633 RepID=A0A835E5X8_9POAL|nr:hypothetical protein HU200_050379 [Digitaria exilis]